MPDRKDTIHFSLRADQHARLAQVPPDPSLRVMVMCSKDLTKDQDIAYPQQSEIRVNGGDVRANLRGLKGKPGTTRPADITKHLRLKPTSYDNSIEISWALNDKGCKISFISGIRSRIEQAATSSVRFLLTGASAPSCRDSMRESTSLPLPTTTTWWRRSRAAPKSQRHR
jgi:hypothetical protein